VSWNRALDWLSDDRTPSAVERDATLRLPLRRRRARAWRGSPPPRSSECSVPWLTASVLRRFGSR
jgi:hypothetical protein